MVLLNIYNDNPAENVLENAPKTSAIAIIGNRVLISDDGGCGCNKKEIVINTGKT